MPSVSQSVTQAVTHSHSSFYFHSRLSLTLALSFTDYPSLTNKHKQYQRGKKKHPRNNGSVKVKRLLSGIYTMGRGPPLRYLVEVTPPPPERHSAPRTRAPGQPSTAEVPRHQDSRAEVQSWVGSRHPLLSGGHCGTHQRGNCQLSVGVGKILTFSLLC